MDQLLELIEPLFANIIPFRKLSEERNDFMREILKEKKRKIAHNAILPFLECSLCNCLPVEFEMTVAGNYHQPFVFIIPKL